MPTDARKRHRHFVLEAVTVAERFRRPAGQGPKTSIPERDRAEQASRLLSQLSEVRKSAIQARKAQEEAGLQLDRLGIQVEFHSFRDIPLLVERLARENMGIELRNVREDDGHIYATVFVPDGKLVHFEKVFRDYLSRKTDKNDQPIDNRLLVDSIKRLRVATLRALWTDDPALFPNEDHAVWWEVWLSTRHDREVARRFRGLVEALGRNADQRSQPSMRTARGQLRFPERTVVMLYASLEQLQEFFVILTGVAELRRPKRTAEFFESMPKHDQYQLLTALLSRTHFPSVTDVVPHICLLDTGVNRAHPLIEPALSHTNLHTVEPGWATADHEGHGTKMAGLALYGDLADLLDSEDHVYITHRLESVKILPPVATDDHDSRHHGYVTQEAVVRPDVVAPHRLRVFAMAVTAADDRDAGRPSAWSAAADKLAAGADAESAPRRLLVVSAGNVDADQWQNYPDSNETDRIHDPAQAWNVLTVGAYTNLVFATEADVYDEPLARAGALSPFSTTSLLWEKHWPLKPDVVFEGRNLISGPHRPLNIDSLSLLTTSHQISNGPMSLTWATSAATALASRFAARVMAVYPDLWPETIRGIIVHSATWTAAMKDMYLATGTKTEYVRLLRRCGFGVPDLQRALWSVADSLTMVVQEHLQPFTRGSARDPVLGDMHIHRLPWPREVLEEMGGAEVEMRVTLSYFIEPNPSARGVRSRYRYESCGLRFDVQRAVEGESDFRKRINVLARTGGEGADRPSGRDSDWLVGPNGRHRGSLHSDIWQGTAADLAQRGRIAVYPTTGWWKTRPKLERYEDEVRYALIVSIRAPDTGVDLYSEVYNIVTQATALEAGSVAI